MTEYEAVCNANSRDVIVARIDGDNVELAARSWGEHKMETYLSPDKARAFARGILALADEIDGGEATKEGPTDFASPSVEIGDQVRITQNWKGHGDENLNAVGRLVHIDTDDTTLPYLVRLDGHDWWCAEVALIDEPAATEPTASPFVAHIEDAKRLLAGTDFTGADVIRLAELLCSKAA